jgi:hypothetical protein
MTDSTTSAAPRNTEDQLVRCSVWWDCTGIIDDGTPEGYHCGHHAPHEGDGDCGCVCNRNIECTPNARADGERSDTVRREVGGSV